VAKTGSSGDVDSNELLMTAAILYYKQDRSQEQIAQELGVSRATVSRFLARARESGIVRIEIAPRAVDHELAPTVAARLGLQRVHIAAGVADPADPGPVLSAPFRDALAATGLRAGDTLLVSWGRAVYSVARAGLLPIRGVVVTPALGGSDGDRPWFQPNEVARLWAAALDGVPRFLHAPAIVSPPLLRSLLGEPGIRSTLRLWATASAAVVGIGAWPKPDSSFAAAGFPTDDPALVDAAGDVAGRSFREDGTLVTYADQRRLLAVTHHRLRRIPHVIGLAAGPDKAKAVVGAARARVINTLVTDAATARAVVDRLDSAPTRPPHLAVAK
jgi:DNA-binding transcriptional regulator LsrR (DeoR family)